MKQLIISALMLLLVATAFGQESTYKKITPVEAGVWKVETFSVYDKVSLLDSLKYSDTYDVPLPDETIYLDSAGLVRYLYVSATNAARQKIARLQNAEIYSRINIEDKEYEDQLDSLGADLDSMRVADYKRRLLGNWKYRANGGAYEKFYTLKEHPSMANRLRMVEVDGPERINVTVGELKRLIFRMDIGDGMINYTFIQQKGTDDRPRFFLDTKVLPNSSLTNASNAAWIKLD